MPETEYQPPDLGLVGADHVRAYRQTDGATGYLWNGVPTLLLSVTGRRSGTQHTSALIFGRHGGDYLVVASMGGAPRHPSWYLNLRANPQATIQVKAEQKTVVAKTASAGERPRLWKIMTDLWPNYDVYQSRTSREIPVVVLTPT